jgi:predicted RNA-binding Zn-ribbon protein involved in translation (DUF1610 family)
MKWLFKGKFSEKVGQDYNYECDTCGKKIKVDDITPSKDNKKATHIPIKKLGGEHHFWCPSCGEFEKW